MKRQMIKIDTDKCNGCGACVPNCAEGALQIVDGKARLISDLFCDGLGACIGHCPMGAIEIEEREALPYDERKTMIENIIPAGMNTVKVHLKHMLDHNEIEYYNQAVEVLKEQGLENPIEIEKKEEKVVKAHTGCPGSRVLDFGIKKADNNISAEEGTRTSQLRQWPVQLQLLRPDSSFFKGADVLIAADCTAYAAGDFHKDFLKNKALAIACPKLDNGGTYVEKIKAMIDEAKINTLTVLIMEVPCCGGLISMVMKAVAEAERKVPVKKIVLGLQGDIISEEWI